MTIKQLDHVNLRTADVAGMVAFYRDLLGFEAGPRPPFKFGGAWLYCGGQAAVHLVEVAETPKPGQPQDRLRLEHFAFQAEGLAELTGRLRAAGVEHDVRVVPGIAVRQVHLCDPDGNHLHIDFAPDEPLDEPAA
jgi:catechol 2,3-dioxygenase-like lactoylglutathione lyase family enzyme